VELFFIVTRRERRKEFHVPEPGSFRLIFTSSPQGHVLITFLMSALGRRQISPRWLSGVVSSLTGVFYYFYLKAKDIREVEGRRHLLVRERPQSQREKTLVFQHPCEPPLGSDDEIAGQCRHRDLFSPKSGRGAWFFLPAPRVRVFLLQKFMVFPFLIQH